MGLGFISYMALGFRLLRLGFRVLSLGFRIMSSGFRVLSLGFRVSGSRLGAQFWAYLDAQSR